MRFDEMGGGTSVMRLRVKEPCACGGRREQGPGQDPKKPRGLRTIGLLPMQGYGSWPILKSTAVVGRCARVTIWASLAGQVWEQQEWHPARRRLGSPSGHRKYSPSGAGP